MSTDGGGWNGGCRLRLVSETASHVVERREAEEVRERAVESLGWPLRDLAANILRVVRGGGKPDDIAPQCAALIDAFEGYRAVCGPYPSSCDISAALAITLSGGMQARHEPETLRSIWAQETMVAGALQIVASKLLDEPSQEAAGRSELYRGVSDLEEARAASHAEWERESPAAFTNRRQTIPKKKG